MLCATALGLSSVGAQEEAAQEESTEAAPLGCSGGRTRTEDGLGCCWPGQVWDASAAACAGTPRCPAGAAPAGLECAVGCPDPMVPVVGGTFSMGSGEGEPDERPVHEVTITSFCIDVTEVTVEAYRACVEASACRAPQADDLNHTFRPLPRGWTQSRERHPINGVSWEDARTYCAWRGGRLPTEAEWEYAARGTDGRVFPWGNEQPRRGTRYVLTIHDEDPPRFTGTIMSVGWFPEGASPFGALDMSGSLWEWVADWYGPYAASPDHDPTGPGAGTHRVLRGGGTSASRAEDIRAANRSRGPHTSRSTLVGFRCARAGAAPDESPPSDP